MNPFHDEPQAHKVAIQIDEPKAVEIYGRSRIAEFDAAEADLGKVLHRKKLTVRRKSPRRGGR